MKIKKKITINLEVPALSIEEGRHKIAKYLRQRGFFVIAREVEAGNWNGLHEEGTYRDYWSIIFNSRGMCIFDMEESEEFSR